MSVEKEMPRVIAMSSGKGGVGKTFFSVHLAAYAASQGKRVLLMDADLGLANVDVMLGVSAQGSVLEMVRGEKALQQLILPTREGFDVLPGGSGLYELTALDAGQQQVMMDEMRSVSSKYDLILIDVAAGIGDNVLYFVSAAESALVVLTPEPTSLTDAYALIKVLSRQRGVKRFMVVVNQAEAFDAQVTFRRLVSVADRYLDVHLDYVGHLPYAPEVRQAIQKQSLLKEQGSPLTRQALDTVLDSILARPRDVHRSGGLQFFWEHSLNEGLSVQAE
ncbi:MAG TPA: flagellar synthesis regulator FleN [Ghiorsea sp.]|nr:flagellar synthesis regulator FleN [Ghiorsea sp.]HIP06741.1 flagellar synthesis regulator FleN [Mariprofundaceae bacterium]